MTRKQLVQMDYQKGKIYKVVSDSTNSVYIGSTCSPLSVRMAGHRNDYRNGKHNYVTSFDLLKNEDCHIVLLESYPCNNKEELFARERYWYDQTENTVNKNKPGSAIGKTKQEYQKQYRGDNDEKIKEYKKQYRGDNDEKIKEHKCKKNNCLDCNGKFTNSHKAKHIKSAKHQNSYIVKIKREHELEMESLKSDLEKFNELPAKLI